MTNGKSHLTRYSICNCYHDKQQVPFALIFKYGASPLCPISNMSLLPWQRSKSALPFYPICPYYHDKQQISFALISSMSLLPLQKQDPFTLLSNMSLLPWQTTSPPLPWYPICPCYHNEQKVLLALISTMFLLLWQTASPLCPDIQDSPLPWYYLISKISILPWHTFTKTFKIWAFASILTITLPSTINL